MEAWGGESVGKEWWTERSAKKGGQHFRLEAELIVLRLRTESRGSDGALVGCRWIIQEMSEHGGEGQRAAIEGEGKHRCSVWEKTDRCRRRRQIWRESLRTMSTIQGTATTGICEDLEWYKEACSRLIYHLKAGMQQ